MGVYFMENYVNGPEIPMGFGMALAQNKKAMEFFANCTPEKQKQILEETKKISSKEEMRCYAESLSKGAMFLNYDEYLEQNFRQIPLSRE